MIYQGDGRAVKRNVHVPRTKEAAAVAWSGPCWPHLWGIICTYQVT